MKFLKRLLSYRTYIYCILLGLLIGYLVGKRKVVEEVTIDNIAIKENRAPEYDISKMEKEEILEERSNKIIYVDAGHGYNIEKYGRTGEYGGTTEGAKGEADYAALLATLLEERLELEGYQVKSIEDLWYDGKKGSRELFGNSGRYNLFINSDCSMMIQIHYDDSDNLSLSGGHIIYGSTSYGSKDLAECIIHNWKIEGLRLNEQYVDTDYIARRNDLTVYNKVSDRPIILVECGFGAKEESPDYYYIRQKETKEKIVEAITEGVNDYYGLVLNKED